MNMIDYIILGCIAVGVILSIRHMKRKGGCCGCSQNCSHCKKDQNKK
ncbi:FeoB-associated Cys-rich membrane protein [Anaerotignum sp.]|nr:FeoB-associated Cys-rich membrane protein [Anaerotignum sp.]